MFAYQSWHPSQKWLLWINVLGGIAVLGSYVHGLTTHPMMGGEIWGGVPESMRPLYTVNMFLAAGGYLLFTGFLLLRVDPRTDSATSRVDYRLWHALYLAILVPSALWMPLTFAMLESSSAGLWWTIRLVLWTVGLASVAIIAALLRLRVTDASRLRGWAVAGAVALALQTAVLDALVWVACIPA